MKTLQSIIIVIVFLTFIKTVPAAATDESKGIVQSDSLKQFENSFIYLPVIFYTPETKTAFGASMSHFFYPDQKMKNRPSSLTPTFIYTTRKQILAEFNTDLYISDKHIIGEFQFLKFPDTFMGIGNNTSDNDKENFTSQSMNLFMSYQKEISPGLYIGPRYFFRDTKILKTADDGVLKNKTISGSKNGTTSGLGLAIHYDTRDNVFYPANGVYHQMSGWVFTDFMGSDYNFRKFNLDMRMYRSFYKNHVLAIRTYFETSFGDVPFQSMAMVGGANLLRGYFQGRYRDKNMFAVQTEYRMPLFWNFGFAGFAGLGDVSQELQKFEFSNFKPCYGFGIRYQIDPKSKLNLRLDFGFGKNSSGTYISINEAF